MMAGEEARQVEPGHDDTIALWEEALAGRSTGFYRLRLFVSGTTPKSARAIANIVAICEQHLSDRYDLEVVDLYQQPHLAGELDVIAAPTLVKELPEPLKRIIGDMSNENKVLLGLDIVPVEGEAV